MFDVRIIENEAVLFDGDNEVNLESLRDEDGDILYDFSDGSSVFITSCNAILWYDSDGMCHRDDDMPAFIDPNGYMSYWNHGKLQRIYNPDDTRYSDNMTDENSMFSPNYYEFRKDIQNMKTKMATKNTVWFAVASSVAIYLLAIAIISHWF